MAHAILLHAFRYKITIAYIVLGFGTLKNVKWLTFIQPELDCIISDSVVTFGYPLEYMGKIGLFCIYKRNYHTLLVLISPIAEEFFWQ